MRNMQVIDGQNAKDAYGLTAAAAANLVAFRVEGDGESRVFGWFIGTSITTSDYNGLPIGSVIFDIKSGTKKVYCKSAATTWVGATLS